MDTLQVSLFGKFEVRHGTQIVSGFEAGRVRELFGFLLLHPARMHPRETLASLIWGGQCTTSQAKTYLRKTLWQLQSALQGMDSPVAGRLLEADAVWIRLAPQADLKLDCAEFETAYTAVSGIAGPHLNAQQAQRLEEAVAGYTGPLLPNWYQDWCLCERERLHDLYLMMLGKLMGHAEAQGAYEKGLVYGRCILKYDPAREHTHRDMMRLYYLAGARTLALRQYTRCAAVLEAELNLRPARSTVHLYEQIRQDAVGVPAGGVALPMAAPGLGAEALLGRLDRLQQGLTDMQQQVQEAIQAMEKHLAAPDPSVD